MCAKITNRGLLLPEDYKPEAASPTKTSFQKELMPPSWTVHNKHTKVSRLLLLSVCLGFGMQDTVCMYAHMRTDAHECQKRGWNPLELEL